MWDFAERSLCYRFVLHKVKVQALAFSPSDKFLATLGGRDDGRYSEDVCPKTLLSTEFTHENIVL